MCTSEQRQLAIKLSREGFSLVLTDNDWKKKEEALTYGVKIPFTVVDGKVEEI